MDYMTVKEASALWGYAPSTIRTWCKNEKISVLLKPVKVSNEWRIPAEASCPKALKKKAGV